MAIDKSRLIEFKDLERVHVLSGVSREEVRIETIWGNGQYFIDANVLNFKLDGTIYSAVEDPDDGYRSCLEGLYVSDDVHVDEFTPHVVVGKVVDDVILELYDIVTNKVVLKVGTDNSDNYYPSFVAEWNPENLAENINK